MVWRSCVSSAATRISDRFISEKLGNMNSYLFKMPDSQYKASVTSVFGRAHIGGGIAIACL